jgi:hypothetical protein
MDRNMTGSLPPNAHESMAGSLIAYAIVFVLMDMVIVALRFYVRLRVIRRVGLDDWALAATLVRSPLAQSPPFRKGEYPDTGY